jgi:hypothetical protein
LKSSHQATNGQPHSGSTHLSTCRTAKVQAFLAYVKALND